MITPMSSAEILLPTAFLLDLLFGDPAWFPHPVRLIGRLADRLERLCRRLTTNLYMAGLLTVVLVLAVTGGLTWGLLYGSAAVNPWLGLLAGLYILYASLAARDLARHSMQVLRPLCANDLALARQQLAMIVGRDTEALDAQGVCRACVESVAENIVDGVTAPLFWAAIFGPLGAMVYKAVNTMDSMFGYKNEQYLKFGLVAARLDDLANFIPARLTAMLVVAVAFLLGYNGRQAWRIWHRDHNCHASPNSGHTEAAVAGALGLQLGGSSSYFGRIVNKPTMGDPGDACQPGHIGSAVRIMYGTVILAVACLTMLHWATNILW